MVLLSGKVARKRKRSTDNDRPDCDKVFVQESGTVDFISESSAATKSLLLNLSDEVLLEILQHCNSVTLDALAQLVFFFFFS